MCQDRRAGHTAAHEGRAEGGGAGEHARAGTSRPHTLSWSPPKVTYEPQPNRVQHCSIMMNAQDFKAVGAIPIPTPTDFLHSDVEERASEPSKLP